MTDAEVRTAAWSRDLYASKAEFWRQIMLAGGTAEQIHRLIPGANHGYTPNDIRCAVRAWCKRRGATCPESAQRVYR